MIDTNSIGLSRRDRDFLRACRNVIARSRTPLTMAQVAVKAASGPAPAFYVSYCHALRRLHQIRSHSVELPDRGRMSLYRELQSRVAALCCAKSLTEADALARVLAEGPAPAFFLTPASAVVLYSELLGKVRRARRHVPLPPSPASNLKKQIK